MDYGNVELSSSECTTEYVTSSQATGDTRKYNNKQSNATEQSSGHVGKVTHQQYTF